MKHSSKEHTTQYVREGNRWGLQHFEQQEIQDFIAFNQIELWENDY